MNFQENQMALPFPVKWNILEYYIGSGIKWNVNYIKWNIIETPNGLGWKGL